MRTRLIMLAVVAAVVLGACGGGGGSTGDPTGAVKQVISLMEAKKFTEVAPLVCAAKRDEVVNALNPLTALASSAPGLDVQGLLDSMSLKFNNLDVKEESRTGDKAVIALKGTLQMDFDKAKLREVMKKAMQAQGQNLTDQQLDQLIDLMSAQLKRGQEFDSKVDVVNEGGKWLICSEITD